MPMQRDRYSKDWTAISNRIRFDRAGGKCEDCGAPHNTDIVRSTDDPARYIVYDDTGIMYLTPDGNPIRMSEIPGEFDIMHHVRVVLTTAHLNHNPQDNRDENLKALCQRCHLRYDAQYHADNARRTRARKKQEAAASAGQQSMFGDTP